MKMPLILWALWLSGSAIAQNPEWQFFVPGEVVHIDGQTVDRNTALVLKHVDGEYTTDTLDFGDLTDFPIPDNAGVSAYTVGQRPEPHHYLVFDRAVGDYLAGEVIRCDETGACDLYFSPVLELGAGDQTRVDALGWVRFFAFNQRVMLVSFDRGFVHNGFHRKPQDLYAMRFNADVYEFIGDSPFLSGASYGLGDANNINATAYYAAQSGGPLQISPTATMLNHNTETVFPSDMFDVFDDHNSQAVAAEFSDKSTTLQAYSALNSGWGGFPISRSNTPESMAGNSTTVSRLDGYEAGIAYTVSLHHITTTGADVQLSTNEVAWINNDNANKIVTFTQSDNAIADGNKMFVLKLNSNSRFALESLQHNKTYIHIIDNEFGDRIFYSGMNL